MIARKAIATCLVAFGYVLSMSAQKSYEIYPVPHAQNVTGETASLTSGVNIVAGPSIDAATVERAKDVLSTAGLQATVSSSVVRGMSNVLLGTRGSRDVADRMAARRGLEMSVFGLAKFDRHILSLYPSRSGQGQVLILGEDTDAVFCGLASLEQMLDRGADELACVDIYDYADIRDRGVIEGYYGVPYSADVTKDLFRFMARYKLNTYMYGAKSDPYHSRYWSEPYPETITAEQEEIGYLSAPMLKEITDVAHACKVNFIWAIHPGTAFTDSTTRDVNAQIMSKFESMYELGVRQFGVFVDDVGVPYDDERLNFAAQRLSDLQARIDARWNTIGAAPADTVKPLHYVPQLYAYGWAYPEDAKRFFSSLSNTPEKISIYITGKAVWSVPNNKDLSTVMEYLGRPLSWWWNYPCNDNDTSKLFPMDTYSNFKDEKHINNLARLEPLEGTNTLIINPMQQGEVSKITLFSVADFAWNSEAFNNDRSWEASFEAVLGKKYAETLRFLAPYLRYFDRDALGYSIANYKSSIEAGKPRPASLTRILTNVAEACSSVKEMEHSEDESVRLFYKDIRPWIFKLESMSREAVALLSGEAYNAPENDEDSQFTILKGMGESIRLIVIEAEPSHEVLQPFIEWLRQNR